jgi:hypothetical protein
MHVVADHVHFGELGQGQLRAEEFLRRQSSLGDV